MLPHRFLALLALLDASLLLPVASLAQSSPVTETVALRHVRPSMVADLVTTNALLFTSDQHGGLAFPSVPSGLTLVAPDDVKSTLTLGGSPESVARFKGALRLLDVPEWRPRRFRLRVRLLRYRFYDNRTADAPRLEEAARMAAEVGPKEPATLSCVADGRVFQLRLSPGVNTDRSVVVGADLRIAGSPFRLPWGTRPAETRSAAAGEIVVFLGRARVPALEQGNTWRTGEEAGYCLEVTASPLPEQSPSRPTRKAPAAGVSDGGDAPVREKRRQKP